MINGIDYLKKMYPGCNDKDYQPSGLDLRLGQVFCLKTDEHILYGLYGGHKFLPKQEELPLTQFKTGSDELDDIFGWILDPNVPYICQVQNKIKIGDNNAQMYLPRSTLLRAGVNVYTALGDLGYNGHLSFLVINHSQRPFFIEEGERFAQLIDFEVQGGSESYDGDYQDDKHKKK